jgi:hypothetical protein
MLIVDYKILLKEKQIKKKENQASREKRGQKRLSS